MTTARRVRWAVLVAAAASAGCGGVNRRFVFESNVPNAQIYVDNKPIGAAPAHAPFEYYGYYTITAVHPGYETYSKRIRITPKWYGYPPFDFLVEVLWPFRVEDTRRIYIPMVEAQQTRVDDLINNADSLRQRGWNLPVPERPAMPKATEPTPVGGVQPLPPPAEPQPMPPGALPPPNPLVPSVTPTSGTYLR
jgi:hypothetical protein